MENVVGIIVYMFLLFISFKILLLLFNFNLNSKEIHLIDESDLAKEKNEEVKYKKDIKLLDLKEILKKRVINT